MTANRSRPGAARALPASCLVLLATLLPGAARSAAQSADEIGRAHV